MTYVAPAHDHGVRSAMPKNPSWIGADLAVPRDVGSDRSSAHEPPAATAPVWPSGTDTEGMLVSLPWSGLQHVPRQELPATFRPSS
jgi:hypothetical protein